MNNTEPPKRTGRILDIPCRYYRQTTDPNVSLLESSFRYVERILPIPADEAALILVDVWNIHTTESHYERAVKIISTRIAPVLQAARAVGMAVVHAPSPAVVRRCYPEAMPPASAQSDQGPDWPPEEFRNPFRGGKYTAFGRNPEPRADDWLRIRATELDIAEPVKPLPGETVIATGDQVHALLAERRILHLFYVGFATNMCVIHRDYGIRAMSKRRGYNCILIRDATTGIEYHDTADSLTATEMAIREVEAQLGWSTTTEAFTRVFRPRRNASAYKSE